MAEIGRDDICRTANWSAAIVRCRQCWLRIWVHVDLLTGRLNTHRFQSRWMCRDAERVSLEPDLLACLQDLHKDSNQYCID